jgi:hypothetical protein
MTDDEAKALWASLSLDEQIALLYRMESDGVELPPLLIAVFEAIP